jgi:L-malate glycosyltransferase
VPAVGEPVEPSGLRILVTVTFNDNQLRSHLMPLLELREVENVILVSDREAAPLPKVRVVVPPRWLSRLLSRAGAKLVVCVWIAVRERPDWILGYHFIPHGFNARVVGALTGTKSLYHMIGGQTEWLGGGWTSENRVLGRLPKSFSMLERIILRLIGGCTAVATLGEVGRATLIARGVEPARIRIFRPSVDTSRFQPSSDGEEPTYDLVSVGRLVPRKQPADIIHALARLHGRGRRATAAIVGEGPLEPELRRLARELGVEDNVAFLGFRHDVDAIYRRARVFVLTSESEGLPISMLEAMSAQVSPVVSNVGEIGGFLRDGEDGYLFPAGDLDALTDRLDELLADESLRKSIGVSAAARVLDLASVSAVEQEYRELFLPSSRAS